MSFGAALRLFRVDAGLSQRELAARIGVSSAYLSRVEHGHDPPPTADRLIAIADVLGMPAGALIELARQAGPAVAGYLDRQPAAAALFLEIARRDLGAGQLARLRAFLDEQMPDPGHRATTTLASLLAPDRVIQRLRCTELADLVDVAVSRLPLPPRVGARELASRVLAREREAPTLLGGGFGAPHALVPGAAATAAIVTLAPPLPLAGPDGAPVRVAVVLVSPAPGRAHLETLARVARLARDGAAADLMAAPSPSRLLATLERHESLW
jgi:nitrogen PTS system EIIA component